MKTDIKHLSYSLRAIAYIKRVLDLSKDKGNEKGSKLQKDKQKSST